MSDALLDLAIHAARGAGSILVERFRAPARGIGTKSTPTDLVSDADRASEAHLRRVISGERPQDGILGEEQDDKASSSGFTWVLDPLDATVNFLFGIPWWAVSVGVADKEGDLIGVIHDPIHDETFSARRGGGSMFNGRPIQVSGCEDLEQALIATGFAYSSAARAIQAEVVARVLPKVRDVRRMGSAALDLCSVACGRIDGFYEATLEEWDKAAGRLIVREAGGVISTLASPHPSFPPGVVAANPRLHDRLKELVSRHGHR